MSPRPRKASDEAVFAATQRLMARVGPSELSLSRIASEAGVTAGALIQRFGSKRQLLLKVVEEWAEGTGGTLVELRARHTSPLGALREYAECVAAMGSTPGALAHHLSYLQMDLTDPEFQCRMRRSAETTRSILEQWLREAVAARQLSRSVSVAGLARLIEATLGGSLLRWAVYQDGSATAWVRADLDALLAPYAVRRRVLQS